MSKYPISVIVPVYNTEQYLARCIESLLRQQVPIRIILVDDGSDDQSGCICDQYASRYEQIRVIHKQNGGSGSAKNAGIASAETELIGFVDSDDWVTEDMYEYLYHLQQTYQADVVQIEYVTVTEGNNPGIISRKEQIDCIDTGTGILKRYLEDGMKPVKSYSTCTKLYRRDLFNHIQFPDGQTYDDVITNYDLLSKANKYVISNKQCYYYFVREKSITQGQFHRGDLDYIKAGEGIVQRTADIQNLQSLGQMTLARFHFTCLCKMLKYGYAAGTDWEKQVRLSIPTIRKRMVGLLKSDMKPDRKILMLLLCANIRATTAVIRFSGERKREA